MLFRSGVRFGRPEVAVPKEFPVIVGAWEHKQITIDEALAKSGMSQATFYRRLKEYRGMQI